ncbi:MAG: hypothetical protein NVS3B26_27790 [Mycobacteriales bacterium]
MGTCPDRVGRGGPRHSQERCHEDPDGGETHAHPEVTTAVMWAITGPRAEPGRRLPRRVGNSTVDHPTVTADRGQQAGMANNAVH